MSEWRSVRLSDVVDIRIGGTPSRSISAFWASDRQEGHLWCAISDLKGRYISETSERITDAGVENSNVKLIEAGSFIMSFKLSIGRGAMLCRPMYTNEAIAGFVPKGNISSNFLYYTLPQVAANAVTDTAVKGATLNKDSLGKIRLRIPQDKTIQEKIVQILQTIDQAIEKTEQLIEKYQQIKAGLMHDLFTRGIGADGKLRPPREQSPELYQETPIGWIPKDWTVLPIESVIESLTDGPFGSNLKSEHYVPEPGVRVVRLQNVNSYQYGDSDKAFVSEKHSNFLFKNKVVSGDVLIAGLGEERYPVGRACCYPEGLPYAINKADCFRARCNESLMKNFFLMLFLNSDLARKQIRRYEQGVTRPRINTGNLKKLCTILPSLAEQNEFVSRFEVVQKQLNVNAGSLEKLKKQKSGLMNDLLTGKVPVSVDPVKAPLSLEQGAA